MQVLKYVHIGIGIKIDRILGLSNNSNNNYKQPTLEDFFKSERIHR